MSRKFKSVSALFNFHQQKKSGLADVEEDLKLFLVKYSITQLKKKVSELFIHIGTWKRFKTKKNLLNALNSGEVKICDKREAKLNKINYKKLKDTRLNKYFLIYSEKLLERLKNESNILLIEKIK